MFRTRLVLSLVLIFVLAPPPLAAKTVVPTSREMIHLSFAPLVKKVAPAVVNVYSRRVVHTRAGPGALFNDPLFRRFFGNTMPFGVPRERIENSLGSGVIVDPSGLIVTNRHVIVGADEIRVVLSDRRQFKAKVILSDKRADLAILKIDTHGEKLPVLTLGNSDKIEVGDLVLAIGDPFGVGQTVTSGIVSGLARSIGENDFGSLIQTDAAINPGNSGGALVDLDGKLIGINAAIFSPSGGSNGIGFAIPSNLVKSVIEAARHGGRVVRPWFGASGQAVSPALAQSFGLSHPEGVLIRDIVPGSPAASAGLQRGDVVLSVGGHDVNSPGELRFRIATENLHAHPVVKFWRDGGTHTAEVTLTAPPNLPPRDLTTLGGEEPLAGATVGDLNPAFDAELGLDATKTGVIVRKVAAGSYAERFGIAPGDLIVSVNDTETDTVRTLQQAVAQAGPWRITLERHGKRVTFSIGD
ncbi:MAG: DegQ family serine endoprotease [Stellaceae bacterium]